MKLIVNIHEKTVAEHDSDPLEKAESLVRRSWPDTNYCTTLPGPAVGGKVEDGRPSSFPASSVTAQLAT